MAIMKDIEITLVDDGNIEQCRDLCNELMAYQKSLAIISPETFDWMNFETRLKASFENSPVNQLIVAKDNGVPIGYVFSSIENVNDGDKSYIPDWAKKIQAENMTGFYPPWEYLPEQVGCLNHLYISDEYRGLGLGKKLLDEAMKWFDPFADVNVIFVYISNGNDAALEFYLKNGFTFSHDVFGGFIKAAYIDKNK